MVRFNLSATTTPTPSQATYTYRVTAQTSDVGKVVATLALTNEGGALARNLVQRERGPTDLVGLGAATSPPAVLALREQRDEAGEAHVAEQQRGPGPQRLASTMATANV